jgi:hypothetical protein
MVIAGGSSRKKAGSGVVTRAASPAPAQPQPQPQQPAQQHDAASSLAERLLRRSSGKLPRVNPWLTGAGLLYAWLHGATVGIAWQDDKVGRLLAFTALLAPFLLLWVSSRRLAIRRLCGSVIYFMISMQLTAWTLSLTWHRNPREIPSLPDLGHDLMGPKWNFSVSLDLGPLHLGHLDADEVPDVFMVGSIVAAVTFTLSHPLRWLILRRYFFIHGTLMIFRCFTVLVTSLPDSHPRCRHITPKGDQPQGSASIEHIRANLQQVLGVYLRVLIPVGEVTCGDMVFSGHTLILVLTALVWHTYYPRTIQNLNIIKTLVWTWSFCGLFAIIGTRLHYTLDVLLAWYLTLTVWSSYHRIANDVIRGHRFCMVWMLDTLLVYPSIEYFEQGVGPEGLCIGVNSRTREEEEENPMASPRSFRTYSNMSYESDYN